MKGWALPPKDGPHKWHATKELSWCEQMESLSIKLHFGFKNSRVAMSLPFTSHLLAS